jgi:hypothetical protein
LDASADAGNVRVKYFSFFEEWNQFIELRAGMGTGAGVANVRRAGGERSKADVGRGGHNSFDDRR